VALARRAPQGIRRPTLKDWRRLLTYLRPHRGRLVAAFAATLILAASSGLLALQIKPILNDVLQAQRNLGLTITTILVLYFVKGLSGYLSNYLLTDVGQLVVRDLRNQLFRHILGQSAAFFSLNPTGKLMSTLSNDVTQVQRAVSETMGDLVRESLGFVVFASMMFYIDPRLAIVCFTGAPLVVYPLVRVGQSVRRRTRQTQDAMASLSHGSLEAITGHRIVKAFGSEARETARFERTSDLLYRTTMKVISRLSAMPPAMEFIGGIAFVVALWYGSRQIGAGDLTVGDFGAFMMALFSMYAPAKKLSRVNPDLQQAMASSERIFAILDTHSEVHERPDAMALPPFRSAIQFRDVTFSYDGSAEETLEGVSFTVRAGQMLAIVGRSGAGKTTLVNLVPRFYDVSGGSILIDGHDVRDVRLDSLRAQIGIVTQETVLFDDTIAANIAYGRPTATREEIAAAARAAHADEFIERLDAGYEAMIGERGHRLSGGQRQRLAIARAILRDSPILILDEATSALDAEAEMLVQEALTNLMANRTSFVIAHRLSTVRRADAIVVLERGRIVETGTHDELIARGGAYAKLYELQLRDEPEGT
jgi:subfamily B ATP-binding cassette protein MsbA